ncbi:transcriptional regulator [Saccharibacillus sp. O23]|uniref:helix-turn-helix transcriptional regulator n=1 Tax=Saccharibacillus sp. O23 TaxID=2009338 RepID=UPI000B4E31A4|nr:WYL domain-containing protein [Saccharibacillus sp. O23]OWR28738.1 transcriptional regulator [Saccharibacillus sp. O23]
MRGDRLLKIVLLLQSRGRMSTRELAEELEVTARTVSRDLEALGQSGIPIVAYRGRFGGWSLMEGYRSGLTGMTPDETAALLLRASSGPLDDVGLGVHYETALQKLRAAYPEPERRTAEFVRRRLLIDESDWNGSRSGVPEALSVCQEAIWAEKRLLFEYAKQPGGTRRVRSVEPLGLVVKQGVWYLAAQDGETVKTFRVSKMEAARASDDFFRYPESFELSAYWAEFVRTFPAHLPRYETELTANEEALRALREERFAHIRRCERISDGEYAVRADLETPEFAQRFVLGLGTSVRVLEPAELASAVAEQASRVTERYRAEAGMNEHRK